MEVYKTGVGGGGASEVLPLHPFPPYKRGRTMFYGVLMGGGGRKQIWTHDFPII